MVHRLPRLRNASLADGQVVPRIFQGSIVPAKVAPALRHFLSLGPAWQRPSACRCTLMLGPAAQSGGRHRGGGRLCLGRYSFSINKASRNQKVRQECFTGSGVATDVLQSLSHRKKCQVLCVSIGSHISSSSDNFLSFGNSPTSSTFCKQLPPPSARRFSNGIPEYRPEHDGKA